MVKLTKYILLACIVLIQQACVKDLQDDINDGGWNHERTILDIQFENQMGTALIETVDAATGDINLAINVDAVPDLSNIRLKKACMQVLAFWPSSVPAATAARSMSPVEIWGVENSSTSLAA